MRIGVVIPTLDEEAGIEAALASLGRHQPADVVVADGGSRDATRSMAIKHVRVVRSPSGRARQLNAGARAVQGEVLLFLHADCLLPAGALPAITHALASADVTGGAFHKRFASSHALLRHVRARTTLWHRLGYVFGDQAMFVRRDAFERLGGFREDVRAEDMDLGHRLRRLGRVVLLEPEVVVSARRLEHAGIVPTWLRWWAIALPQAIRGAAEGPRQGALSSEARSCRGWSERE